MKTNIVMCILLSGLMLASSSVICAADKEKPELKKQKITMNAAQVNKCVKILPEFMKQFPAFNPMTGTQAQPGASPNIAAMVATADIKKLNAFASSNGYKDFNDFARNFTGVMSGYMYFKTLQAKKMFQDQLKALPKETAAMLSMQMKPINDSLAQIKKNVSPGLLKAVEPHMPALDALLGLTE